MTAHYIPDDDMGKLLWFQAFNTWFQAHGAAHGFSPADIAELTAKTAEFDAAIVANEKAKAASKAATAGKNAARAALATLARQHAQRLQTDRTMTDGERAAAGLTVPDTTPTPTDREAIFAIVPPLLLLDFSIRRQVTIHWGPNPGNERNNARPAGVFGCDIQCARGGEPEDEAGWMQIDISTKSPSTHHVQDTVPTTYAYRARYIAKTGKRGPFGDPATCTVSV
jgi:hypothetical protein